MRVTSAFLPLAVVVLALSSSTVLSQNPAKATEDGIGAAEDSTAEIIGSLEGLASQFLDDDGKPIQYIETGGNPLGEDDEEDDDDDEAAATPAGAVAPAAAAVAPVGAAAPASNATAAAAPLQARGKGKGKGRKGSRKARHHKQALLSEMIRNKAPPMEMLLHNNIKTTWYASHDLLNPACGTGKWNPTNNAHIGAISTNWKSGPKCGEFMDICNEKTKPHKCVTVRRIDDCAGCKNNHVDLTKAAFRSLSPSGGLDEGVLEGLKLYRQRKQNPWDGSLFGPIKLNFWHW